MSKRTEKITITDKLGFIYSVTVEHFPHKGFSNALYDDRIIGQVELGRILEPMSDDDREWEMYEDRFAVWSDEVKVNMERICKVHFNRKS